MKKHLALLSGGLLAAFLVSCSLSGNKTICHQEGGIVPNASEAIDLGLSVKWAPWNLGACHPSDYGDYYMWGEVKPKKDENGIYGLYDWYTYAFYKSTETESILCKYNETDHKTQLDSSDDAAIVNWGGKWRMPTQAEWKELANPNNCKWLWTDNYNRTGCSGYFIKSRKSGFEDAALFLPAAGFRLDSTIIADVRYGHYWSSNLSHSEIGHAMSFVFRSDIPNYEDNSARGFGRSVRAVCPRE